jgi:transcriptional regulator with XRE-family HTH domain
MTFNYEQFADDLLTFRTKKEWSRRRLAMRTNMKPETYRQLENAGIYEPKITHVLKLCNFMQTDFNKYLS